jgi:putative transposase
MYVRAGVRYLPRNAREKSITGIYHIMLRGIDKRNLFFDDEDRARFIENLIKSREKGKFENLGYCLMDNHIHLLLKESEDIGTSMKRITVSYAGWNNRKYERTGHLFQNRYLSEPVEKEGYLLTVLRYIHQNPVKAGIVKAAADYQWSSYQQYRQYYCGQDSLVKGDLIRAYFNSYNSFNDYMSAYNNDKCLEMLRTERFNDERLLQMICKKHDVGELLVIPKIERDALIKDIYSDSNTSIRQLSRVLGISKAIVAEAVKDDS